MTTAEGGSGRADPDFAMCPNCGEPLSVASEENLYGKHALDLTIDHSGNVVSANWTTTEPWWDTSVTTNYLCLECGIELPEDYQRVLDVVLGNERYVVDVHPSETPEQIAESIRQADDLLDVKRQAQALWGND